MEMEMIATEGETARQRKELFSLVEELIPDLKGTFPLPEKTFPFWEGTTGKLEITSPAEEGTFRLLYEMPLPMEGTTHKPEGTFLRSDGLTP